MKKSFVGFLACGLMIGFTAQAQEVVFTGEKCPLNIVAVRSVETNIEGETEGESTNDDHFEVELESVDFLGTIDGNEVAVRYAEGENVVYALASLEDAMGKVPAVDFDSLPSVNDWTDIGVGSSGDAARSVQQAFVDISVMGEDQVDGMYGEGTAAIVSAFQADNKLQPTGTVDVYTWFVLQELKENPAPITTVYPPTYNAEEKFSSIYDHAADPDLLDAFTDIAWRFHYDPFEGSGEITLGEGIHIGSWSEDGPQIDKLQMDVDLTVYVFADEEGVVYLVPAFKVESVGSYRPYVESIDLKIGNDVAKLPILVCDGKVEGTELTETAIVPVSEVITGDGLLRVKGASRDYEIAFTLNDDFSKFFEAEEDPTEEETELDEEETEEEFEELHDETEAE